MLKFIEGYGANFKMFNKNGESPLFYAFFGQSIECAKFLVEKGCDLFQENHFLF